MTQTTKRKSAQTPPAIAVAPIITITVRLRTVVIATAITTIIGTLTIQYACDVICNILF